MPKLKDNQVPAHRLHKQSGQALVTLNGRDICLGVHDTPASREKFERLTDWIDQPHSTGLTKETGSSGGSSRLGTKCG